MSKPQAASKSLKQEIGAFEEVLSAPHSLLTLTIDY
jgi:hypothetical protein